MLHLARLQNDDVIPVWFILPMIAGLTNQMRLKVALERSCLLRFIMLSHPSDVALLSFRLRKNV
jgi:hypothetical protein